jgi:hypothetical protein
MGAPEFVPTDVNTDASYTSPPRRPGSWVADRPGDFDGLQPSGDRLGSPGPDAGYALTLVEHVRSHVVLTKGEHADDALAAVGAIAMKRAALFGRAPVIHDVRVGMAIWGFAWDADAELVDLRRGLLEEVHHPHHYAKLRDATDLVPDDLLRAPHGAIIDASRADWRSALAIGA